MWFGTEFWDLLMQIQIFSFVLLTVLWGCWVQSSIFTVGVYVVVGHTQSCMSGHPLLWPFLQPNAVSSSTLQQLHHVSRRLWSRSHWAFHHCFVVVVAVQRWRSRYASLLYFGPCVWLLLLNNRTGQWKVESFQHTDDIVCGLQTVVQVMVVNVAHDGLVFRFIVFQMRNVILFFRLMFIKVLFGFSTEQTIPDWFSICNVFSSNGQQNWMTRVLFLTSHPRQFHLHLSSQMSDARLKDVFVKLFTKNVCIAAILLK